MLEKIGLPSKPSLRGSAWVVDASHCQGCSSQFSFINRKHHCRRCGGIFCSSCTQARMVLRGQGDSTVRICEPCKRLEEAARFEIRHGHRNKSGRGSSKLAVKSEDDVLDQILGSDGIRSLSGVSSTTSDLQRATSNTSSSSFIEESRNFESPSIDQRKRSLDEVDSSSPEDLLQRALEEKKKYSVLKKEGHPEEALRAFKRGKELEREAKALEVALRKNKKSIVSSMSLSGISQVNANKNELGRKNKISPQKDDLASELRDLGWSDADLHDFDAKPANMSLEGELSSLISKEKQKEPGVVKVTSGIDKSQVLEIKKKALMFKREGKLAEAKEELKRAKVLEKQLEEQEMLAEADESDDELSALIRGMDDDTQNDTGYDFDQFDGINDGDLVGNFEVTDEDLADPDMASALKSLGWAEEDLEHTKIPVDVKVLQDEVLSLKREAIVQKRAGNVAEAMSVLKKAKLIERDIEGLQSQEKSYAEDSPMPSKLVKKSPPKSKLVIQRELLSLKKSALTLRREGKVDEAEEELKKGKILELQLEEMESGPKLDAPPSGLESVLRKPDISTTIGSMEEDEEDNLTENDMNDPALLELLQNLGWKDEDVEPETSRSSKQVGNSFEPSATFILEAPSRKPVATKRKSKAEIQRELLGLKRKALTLRRQGEVEEAEELMKKAKALEEEIEEMEEPKMALIPNSSANQKSYGATNLTTQTKLENTETAKKAIDGIFEPAGSLISPDINLAPLIPNLDSPAGMSKNVHASIIPQPSQPMNLVDLLTGDNWNSPLVPVEATGPKENKNVNPHDHLGFAVNPIEGLGKTIDILPGKKAETAGITEKITTHGENSSRISIPQNSLQQEILGHKRKALALKREGRLAEAREELKQAKLLEKTLQENDELQSTVIPVDTSISMPISATENTPIAQEIPKPMTHTLKPLTSRERFKLQQESLGHKRQALKFRREGRINEADAETELAKAIEARLEESDNLSSSNSSKATDITEGMGDLEVEDLLDPQLLSALKAIGIQDVETVIHPIVLPPVPKKSPEKPEVSRFDLGKSTEISLGEERKQLEDRIKSEKVKALNLKRAGKTAEALDALRRSKLIEKKLNQLAS